MNKRRLMELFVVGLFIILVGYFIILVASGSFGQERSSTADNKECPILVVSLESSDYQRNSEGCFVVINGSLINLGDKTAEDTIVRCRPSVYTVIETEIQASKKIGDLEAGKQIFFEVERSMECSERFKFDCIAECQNACYNDD